jgi:hypothetical protein
MISTELGLTLERYGDHWRCKEHPRLLMDPGRAVRRRQSTGALHEHGQCTRGPTIYASECQADPLLTTFGLDLPNPVEAP